MREIVQATLNIDEIKKQPLLVGYKPLLTKEQFDRAICPLATAINDLAETCDKGKAILDVVQNIYNGVQNVGPIRGTIRDG